MWTLPKKRKRGIFELPAIVAILPPMARFVNTLGLVGQGYRIWSDSLNMGLVLAIGHARIHNLATNTAALWLLESGISVMRPEKNPYAIALRVCEGSVPF